ncbi:unnamed protein product [Urochloa decumbens]|uniref:RBR-type E3 ubiquitin transferase n=1 Tax=Urochloa decumbens TaxID=240449 RepID=A0ABC9D0P9_9POAL
MGRGDGDEDGCSHRSKRRHGSGGESSREDTRPVPVVDISDDDDDMGIGEDDDDMYEYDYSDDDDAGEDLEEEETMADDSPAAAAASSNKGYTVLTEDRILERQQEATSDVAEVLSIPSSFAVLLLRHFKWSTTRVKDEWFSDDRRVRDAVGLPPDAGVPMSLSRRRLPCGVCFGRFNAGKMRSAGCSHYYCDACWGGYIHAAVGDGPRCLSLRCPDPACSAAVAQDLVDAVADAEDKERYGRFALRSFVEEGGGSVKWCPAPGCTRAVELAGGGCAMDVFCECSRHGFCWGCGEEAHRPVSCETVRAWLAKNVSDAETANWVLANTKHCPMCRRPIEKNQGCNHMTCSAPCSHQFCWLCLDPWKSGHYCSRYYDYDHPRRELDSDMSAQGKAARKEEVERRQAKASLDRYLYHYQRWASNRTSLNKALDDMDQLRRSGLDKMAAALEIKVEDLEFLTKAYELIADGRRLMRWVYAYGYYLDPVRDKAKRGLFDHLLEDANTRLESLHHCAEVERRKFTSNQADSADAMNEMYRAYKKHLEGLTSVTRQYFGNLVKAFETDLPEFNSVKK